MKGSRKQENMQNKQGIINKPVPEIRDNMDSRHNKEDKKTIPTFLKNRETGSLKIISG